MTGTLPPLLDSVVGGGTPERSCVRVLMDPMLLCRGKSLVLPNQNVDDIAKHSRFLILSLPNNEMSKKSPFDIEKTLKRIGGDPKSIRNRGVISEPDLLCASETEILEGPSDQGITQKQQTNSFSAIPNICSSYKTYSYIHNYTNRSKYNKRNLPTSMMSETHIFCKSDAKYLVLNVYCLTSSSSTQAHLLPSSSSIKPITQIESRLPEPISSSAGTPDNSLNTSALSLSTETCPVPTTFNEFATLSTEVKPSVPLPE
ncbi:hypothetical protein TNCV_1661 [Trichonephila clavipes]|nr:hypothetical protein TNCV_1661 [Trichonephila clavipes]